MSLSTKVLSLVYLACCATLTQSKSLSLDIRVKTGNVTELAKRDVVEPFQVDTSFIEVDFGLGTAAQSMVSMLDTGSGELWVGSESSFGSSASLCENDGCLNSADSSTFESTSSAFSVAYVGGTSAKGTYAEDVITIGGVSFDFTFGFVTSATSDYSVFGVRQMLAENKKGWIIDFLMDNDLISDEIIAISYDADFNYGSNVLSTGTVTFGEYDTSAYSEIYWVDLSTETLASFATAGYTDSTGTHTVDTSGQTFLLDTGSTALTLNTNLYNSIMTDFSYASGYSGFFTCSDYSDRMVTFELNGAVLSVPFPNLSYQAYQDSYDLCQLLISSTTSTTNILGQYFMKNVYSVFDFSSGQLGIGSISGYSSYSDSSSPQNANEETSSTTSSSSSTSSTTSTKTTPTTTSTTSTKTTPTTTSTSTKTTPTTTSTTSTKTTPTTTSTSKTTPTTTSTSKTTPTTTSTSTTTSTTPATTSTTSTSTTPTTTSTTSTSATPIASSIFTASTEATSTTSTEATSTEATSTEATSTKATSTEATSTEATSTEATSTEAISTEVTSTEATISSSSSKVTTASSSSSSNITSASSSSSSKVTSASSSSSSELTSSSTSSEAPAATYTAPSDMTGGDSASIDPEAPVFTVVVPGPASSFAITQLAKSGDFDFKCSDVTVSLSNGESFTAQITCSDDDIEITSDEQIAEGDSVTVLIPASAVSSGSEASLTLQLALDSGASSTKRMLFKRDLVVYVLTYSIPVVSSSSTSVSTSSYFTSGSGSTTTSTTTTVSLSSSSASPASTFTTSTASSDSVSAGTTTSSATTTSTISTTESSSSASEVFTSYTVVSTVLSGDITTTVTVPCSSGTAVSVAAESLASYTTVKTVVNDETVTVTVPCSTSATATSAAETVTGATTKTTSKSAATTTPAAGVIEAISTTHGIETATTLTTVYTTTSATSTSATTPAVEAYTASAASSAAAAASSASVATYEGGAARSTIASGAGLLAIAMLFI